MLRKLEIRDAKRMLEWMHDDDVLKGLQSEMFKRKTLADCESFINLCQDKSQNCHMAIVDDRDLYQGTVSLKLIDSEYKDAEFAIVLRGDAQGYGYALNAMKNIMQIAFEEYGLDEVYWNVLSSNISAIRLYEKGGYKKLENISKRRWDRAPKKTEGDMERVMFFHITREEYFR